MPKREQSILSDANRLRRLRQILELSQREMAEEFRVAPGAIAFWESGKRRMSGPALKLLELYEEEFGLVEKAKINDFTAGHPVSRSMRLLSLSLGLSDMAAEWLKLTFMKSIAPDSKASTLKKNAYCKMATRVADRLIHAKGLQLKAFHVLGHLDFALPSEAREVIRSRQSLNSPMSQKKLAEVFVREYGSPPKQVFSAWTTKPIATASIGQVHLARLKTGEHVAVKVQYPKITKSIRSDLKNIELLGNLMSFLLPQQDRRGALTELRDRFLEECDYLNEARNQEFFRQLYRGRPEIIIPKVYSSHTTTRALVSEFVPGISFHDFCKTASCEARNKAGEIIWKFGFESVFKYGVFNADPHPGNYLFLDGKVVFLDFGCVKKLDTSFVREWKKMILLIRDDDFEGYKGMVQKAGFAPRPELFDFRHNYEASKILYGPFIRPGRYPIDSDWVRSTWRGIISASPNRSQQNIPKDWVFLTRLSWGLGSVIAGLGAIANWYDIAKPLLENSMESATDSLPRGNRLQPTY